jgi:hypothetical protein
VLRVRKALYGLRQAPRSWNAKLDSSLVKIGFTKCLYVDDLIITCSSAVASGEFKTE